SNLYLLRREGRPTLTVEHRAHRSPEPLVVKLEGDPPRLVIEDAPPPSPTEPIDERVVAALAERPLTRTALRDRLGVRNETLGAAIERLLAAKRLIRVDDGLAVPVPALGDRRERNGP